MYKGTIRRKKGAIPRPPEPIINRLLLPALGPSFPLLYCMSPEEVAHHTFTTISVSSIESVYSIMFEAELLYDQSVILFVLLKALQAAVVAGFFKICHEVPDKVAPHITKLTGIVDMVNAAICATQSSLWSFRAGAAMDRVEELTNPIWI